MDSLNFEILINNIGQLAKRRGISRNKALMDSGAGKDFVTNTISKGQIPSILKIAQLANYFDCSIDYLLDRTDEPQSHKTKSSNSVNGNYNAVDNSSVTVNNSPLDEHQKTLLDIYNKLTPIQQAQLLVEADKMAEK